MSSFQIIDLIFLILVVLMIFHGYVKGFLGEIFSWASLVFSIMAAVVFYPAGAAFIRRSIMENVRHVPEVLAFIAIFLMVMLFIKMLERVLKDIIAGAKLGGVNKVLGAVFGLIEGLALVTIIVFFLYVQPVFDVSRLLEDSVFAQILLPIITVHLDRGMGATETAFPGLQGIISAFLV